MDINCLAHRYQEVETLISFNKLDILLLTETFYRQELLYDFSFYETQHPNGTDRGASAIIIKNSIEHCEIPGYKKITCKQLVYK